MTTPTRMLRWRPYDRPFADKALGVGDTGIDGLDALVVIEKRGALRDGTGGWSVVIRQQPDDAFDDGWLWTSPVVGPHESMENLPSEREAKALVADHWEAIEAQARDMLAAGTAAPVAAEDAAEEQHARLAEEALGFAEQPNRMLDELTGSRGSEEVVPREQAVIESIAPELARIYEGSVESIVHSLRRCADDIERKRIPTDLMAMKPNYSQHAAEIIDDVNTMVGNLSTTRLLRSARDADEAARGRKP